MITLQLALAGFVEVHVLHLSRLNPDFLYIHQDSSLQEWRRRHDGRAGVLQTCPIQNHSKTPDRDYHQYKVQVLSWPAWLLLPGKYLQKDNLWHDLNCCCSVSRCLVHPSFKIQALIRAVLRDEMIAWHKKAADSSQQQSSLNLPIVHGQPL